MCKYLIVYTPGDDMSLPEIEKEFESFKEARQFAWMIRAENGSADLYYEGEILETV